MSSKDRKLTRSLGFLELWIKVLFQCVVVVSQIVGVSLPFNFILNSQEKVLEVGKICCIIIDLT